ncbi:MAG: DUF433 domain-containing protein [Fibrobacteria bacterium]
MSNASPSPLVPSSRIVAHPSVLGGKPFIKNTRLSVEFLQGLLSSGWSPARILDVYQYLEAEDLHALGTEARPH